MGNKRNISILLLVVALAVPLLATACGSGGANSLGGIPEPRQERRTGDRRGPGHESRRPGRSKPPGNGRQQSRGRCLPPSVGITYAEIETHYAGLLGENWVVQETDAVLQARAQGIEAKIWRNEEKGQTLSIQFVNAEALGGNLSARPVRRRLDANALSLRARPPAPVRPPPTELMTSKTGLMAQFGALFYPTTSLSSFARIGERWYTLRRSLSLGRNGVSGICADWRRLCQFSVSSIFIAALLVALYGGNSLLLAALHLRRREARPPQAPEPETWPTVTVQLPIYNELYVVKRLIDAVARIDYPRHRLQIQVLDDSTDETTRLIKARVAFHHACGLDIELVHRADRQGFKAGALAQGLERAKGELSPSLTPTFCRLPTF